MCSTTKYILAILSMMFVSLLSTILYTFYENHCSQLAREYKELKDSLANRSSDSSEELGSSAHCAHDISMAIKLAGKLSNVGMDEAKEEPENATMKFAWRGLDRDAAADAAGNHTAVQILEGDDGGIVGRPKRTVFDEDVEFTSQFIELDMERKFYALFNIDDYDLEEEEEEEEGVFSFHIQF